ncbi:MAG TPA: hypothetical protein VMM18_06020 [Gemmatimonadaceae bacterium]|nr:hypothetical protein [Gemmatimonadaceae bacterium]
MNSDVRRLGRYGDLAGILCLVAGAGFYIWAAIGMQLLQTKHFPAGGPRFEAMAEFDRLYTASRVGIVFGAVGVAVLIVTAVFVRLRAPRA